MFYCFLRENEPERLKVCIYLQSIVGKILKLKKNCYTVNTVNKRIKSKVGEARGERRARGAEKGESGG